MRMDATGLIAVAGGWRSGKQAICDLQIGLCGVGLEERLPGRRVVGIDVDTVKL
jgi:hypothetical protein